MLHPRHRVMLASVSAMAILLAGSIATVASQPRDVTIVSHTERGCPAPSSTSCWFTATGAIDDDGTVISVPIVAGALASPVVGTAQWIKTYEGQQGSFTIRLESRVTIVGDSLQAAETGRWVIIDATGAYAGLEGRGSAWGTRDYGAQSLEATLEGQVN